MTWATSAPILGFLGLSVLELGQKYATDRQTDRQTDVRKTDVRQTSNVRQQRLMPHLLGARHNNKNKVAPTLSC